MRKLLLTVLLTLVVAPWAFAHEGHDHKVMGVVSTIHDARLEVTAIDGKTSAIVLNDKTKVLRGRTAVKPADIKEGDRVVVTATETKQDGTVTFVAKEIRLGTK